MKNNIMKCSARADATGSGMAQQSGELPQKLSSKPCNQAIDAPCILMRALSEICQSIPGKKKSHAPVGEYEQAHEGDERVVPPQDDRVDRADEERNNSYNGTIFLVSAAVLVVPTAVIAVMEGLCGGELRDGATEKK